MLIDPDHLTNGMVEYLNQLLATLFNALSSDDLMNLLVILQEIGVPGWDI